jgi:hypothetical protein
VNGKLSEDGEWYFATHGDGTEQVFPAKYVPHLYIERVVRPKSRRKQWCLVSRDPLSKWGDAMYPPKLAGPFGDLDAAKVALVMTAAAQK